MPAIGYVQMQANGGFKGQLRTLSVRADIEIVPNRSKSGDQPDYRVLSDGFELGVLLTPASSRQAPVRESELR